MLKSISDPYARPALVAGLHGPRRRSRFVDANQPAATHRAGHEFARLIQLPGMSMETAIRAIMSVYPLDDFDPDPVR